MNGLELSEGFYREYGAPMIERDFPDLAEILAIGLVGAGSECYGYDDEVSRDHDFEPGFCIFVPENASVDRRTLFLLERAYARLPKEYKGVPRLSISPVGGNRHGVIMAGDFYAEKIGKRDGFLTETEWLTIPEYALAEATNGAVFRDDEGSFSAVRQSLLQMPEDVRLKKLAGHLLMMAQSGQYNYQRCLSHGESAAAQLAVVEFVKHTMAAIFLCNRAYMPYYKWSFRALRQLPLFNDLADTLEILLTTSNDTEFSVIKYDMIEMIADRLISHLRTSSLSNAICGDLEKHAYSINDHISDSSIRNLNIMFAVE